MQSKNSRSKKGADKKNSDSGSMQSTQLMDLFENELKDIYWAEKAFIKVLFKMAKNATDQELAEAIENHLEETLEQVEKLERVFELIEVKPVAKKCEAMAGLLKEGEEIMKDTEKGPQRDAGIISAAQKVEHYEIASYGTLRTFATTLGLDEAAEILEEILEEEKKADETLSEIAKSTINVEALEEEAEEETGEE
ncbi:MAG: YciE/YciF ferroxidase family protein [Bacteroidia bacterium]